jgi:hypothetical protein
LRKLKNVRKNEDFGKNKNERKAKKKGGKCLKKAKNV